MMNLIQSNFGIEAPLDNEEKLRLWLENRISYMLEYETDLLLSTLYRLDIDEQKIKEVLELTTLKPVSLGLTDLVIDRQRQRHITKLSHPVDQTTFYWGDEE